MALIDPFDILPLSPALDRVPISTNARYSFPALARNPHFDSALIGTSTSRELQPSVLNPLLDAHVVNLAMNAATAYEQYRLMTLFARHHPEAKYAFVGIDIVWCQNRRETEKYTPRPFPEWMYDENLWQGFAHIFDLYSLEQAGRQFAVRAGWRPAPYGLDGYTNFLPDETRYDFARVKKNLDQVAAARDATPTLDGPLDAAEKAAADDLPALPMLRKGLAAFSPSTRKIVFIVPYNVAGLAKPGTADDVRWQACKAAVAEILRATPGATGVDFMIPSPISREASNYWDGMHYRLGIGVRIAHDLVDASRGVFPATDPDYVPLK